MDLFHIMTKINILYNNMDLFLIIIRVRKINNNDLLLIIKKIRIII